MRPRGLRARRDRRTLLWCSALALFDPAVAFAQAARRVARVGWLGWSGDTAPVLSMPLEGLRKGLRELGWAEGDNLDLDIRIGDYADAATLAAEMVRARVEVIVVQGPMVFSARTQTGSTPVVFAINGDPVEAGLVASFARPGGNLTGITALSTELAAKRLELLKQVQPRLTKIAALANDRHPGVRIELEASQAAARQLGVTLQYFPVRAPEDFDAAFEAMASERISALVAFPDTLINRQIKRIAAFASRQRVPAISGWAEFAHAGNLMSYGPGQHDFYRHAAVYADKLLRGAKAADLPVERPAKFEFIVNQKAARAIGLTIPSSVLLRADELIE